MWYFAEILFAEPKDSARSVYLCESCDVLFSAKNAEEAYRKSLAWGKAYVGDDPAGMQVLGVSRLVSILEEPGDGVEVYGSFFEEPDVWERADELIPTYEELGAIQWEKNPDTPIQDVMSPKQVDTLKRRMGHEET